MNLQLIVQILEAIVADYASFEAGGAVTTPAVLLDLSVIGVGKVNLTLTAKKAV